MPPQVLAHGLRRDAEARHDVNLSNARGLKLEQLAKLSIGEFRGTYAFTRCLPSLGDFVRHVVGLTADKQVGRIHAWRVVASVAHDSARVDGPMMKFIGESVGADPSFAMVNVAVSVALDRPDHVQHSVGPLRSTRAQKYSSRLGGIARAPTSGSPCLRHRA